MHRETAHAGSLPVAGARARAWPAPAAVAVVVFVLLRLAFDEGGYFPAAFTSAGAIAFIALAVLVVSPTQKRFSTPALVAIGALAAFAGWTGLSRVWSVVPDVPLLDMQRAMLYVALFGLALLAADSGRHARLLVGCVLGVIVVVAGAGLLSRLQPDVVSSATDAATRLAYRLDHPLHYWNAFGALASAGAVLAIGLAADARGGRILRPVAAGVAVLLVVTMYLSLSRGAWLALILGLLVLAAIAPNRGSLLLTFLIAGGAAAVAILRLRGYPALVLDPKAGSGQAAQGDAFTLELFGLVALAVAAQAAVAVIRPTASVGRRMRAIRRIALIAAGVLVIAAGAAVIVLEGGEAQRGVTSAANDTSDWLDRQWRDFLDPATSAGAGNARLISAKGARSDHYRVAIDGFEAHPLIGGGAGSFEVRYARDRNIDVKIRDAHSLPLETLTELGVVGMLLLLGFLAAVVTAARRALDDKGAVRPAEAAAVTAALAVWLGHACVDWDWEMPALTGTAFALCATLCSRQREVVLPTGARASGSPTPGSRRRWARPGARLAAWRHTRAVRSVPFASELAKFVAAAAIAGLVGLGIGSALSKLAGNDDPGPLLRPQTVRESTPGQGIIAAPGSTPETRAPSGEVRARVLSARLRQATTPSGRRRRRARLSVKVRVTNASAGRLPASDPAFISGGTYARVDPDAEATAGDLLKPLGAGDTATGELRFEIAGALTKRVVSERRGQLRIAGQTIAVRVRVAARGG